MLGRLGGYGVAYPTGIWLYRRMAVTELADLKTIAATVVSLVADAGKARIVSVKLACQAAQKVPLKDVVDR